MSAGNKDNSKKRSVRINVFVWNLKLSRLVEQIEKALWFVGKPALGRLALVVVAEFYAGKYAEGKIGRISASIPAAPKLARAIFVRKV
jgi:hypothetical protein